jgi:AbrB family looped-hinge helix DNA binding protein
MIMPRVTVSTKYQVVIPKEIRESIGLEVGQTLQVITYQNRIELVPIKPIRKMKGFLPGLNTDVAR